jgi:hypothetical protein
MATDERIPEAEELASLLGNLYPAYKTLLNRPDFRDPLTDLADKLAEETRGTPVSAELQVAKTWLGEVDD